MAWRREMRIMIFMQMELKACWNELDWLIRCHNCAAYNCPEEEYPPRPLPILPDYIDNLQSRLGKVKKGIYSKDGSQDVLLSSSTSSACSSTAAGNFTRSAAQWYDEETSGRGAQPQERPQALEEEDKVIDDGTSHVDQGGDFVFQTEVGMDLETL